MMGRQDNSRTKELLRAVVAAAAGINGTARNTSGFGFVAVFVRCYVEFCLISRWDLLLPAHVEVAHVGYNACQHPDDRKITRAFRVAGAFVVPVQIFQE